MGREEHLFPGPGNWMGCRLPVATGNWMGCRPPVAIAFKVGRGEGSL